jgi:SDR family mycofactocin-dependent oxidoreductase
VSAPVNRPGRVAGKVAFITGAARGLGRSHAVRLAEEGADIVAVDLCRDDPESPYQLGRSRDLDETARLVEKAGARIITAQADVRDQAALDAAAARAIEAFGHLDVIVPNAGLVSFGRAWELTEEQWNAALGVILTGVWHTVKATLPAMIEAGRGGSVVVIGSVNSLRGAAGISHYAAAKHGLVGFARSLALEVAEYSIRVNLVAPGTVETVMATSPAILQKYRPDLDHPTLDNVDSFLRARNPLPVRSVDPADVSNAVVYFASDDARNITGTVLPVDAGWMTR